MKLAVLEKGDGFIIRARTGEALNIGENTCISKLSLKLVNLGR